MKVIATCKEKYQIIFKFEYTFIVIVYLYTVKLNNATLLLHCHTNVKHDNGYDKTRNINKTINILHLNKQKLTLR